MLALSFMKGDLVNDWVDEQIAELEGKATRTNNPIPRTDEGNWTEFRDAFISMFTDTTKKQKALAALSALRMEKGNLDGYVATFKTLVKKIGYDLSHGSTV
jgi:hypothetical protein